jgi:hypothetical protein
MKHLQSLYAENVTEDDLCADVEGCLDKATRRCLIPRHPQAPTVKPLPQCLACVMAKAQRRNTEATQSKPNPVKADALTRGNLAPGEAISIDHYESSVRGRLPNTQGREGEHRQYCGGTIFVDHASRFVAVHHQVSLDAAETLLSKRAFELDARRCGVEISTYHADNNVFDSKQFTAELQARGQYADFSGVGAHHQNGIAERAIRSVVTSARAMMIHASHHWPEQFNYELWPFALSYAAWLHNHTPQASNKLAPAEIFCGTNLECMLLRRARVWGCPTYVLDPRLQDGKKIPKWDPRARRGQFLGFSKDHSSSIGIIRNLRTGYVTPQYHVVYDETFSTVEADEVIADDPVWMDLIRFGREHVFEGEPVEEKDLPRLHPDWLSDAERARLPRNRRHRQPVEQPVDDSDSDDSDPGVVAAIPPAPNIVDIPIVPDDAFIQVQDDGFVDQGEDGFAEQGEPEFVQQGEPEFVQQGEPLQEDEGSSSDSDSSQPSIATRRSDRVRRPNPRYVGGEWATQVNGILRRRLYNYSTYLPIELRTIMGIKWHMTVEDPVGQTFASFHVVASDPYTGEIGYQHPFALQARTNADEPSIREVLQLPAGPEKAGWDYAMDLELHELQQKGTFEFCNREEAQGQVIPSTWVFRRKFKPDGSFSKLKARFCVRGDLQKDVEGETFAPVVDWGTLRLVFSLAIAHNLHTTQIDFKNAFVQAPLSDPIYLELPPGKWRTDPTYAGKVLRVKKSLYGDRRAPNLWYMHLRRILEKEGFFVSSTDPCLFLRDDCLVVVYVDDCIITTKDVSVANRLLERFKDVHNLDFTREGDLAAYLGVSIAHNNDGTLTLTQPALTRRIVEALGLRDSRPVPTPVVEPLGRCLDQPEPTNEFNYRSVVGMLNYLANSTRLDISFAVHQCARFSSNPRLPHEIALKRIGRYLAGTLDNGLIIRPDKSNLAIDCFCDADFAGLWTYEDVQDPTCTRSRTGYLLTVGGTPIVWSSRLQTETALSTMEAEYIALSTAMRALLPMRNTQHEILSTFFARESQNVSTISSVWEDNQSTLILANATNPPRLTPRSKHIAIKYHWFRDYLSPDTIQVKAISTMEQKANILTKPLVREKFLTDRLLTMGW